MTHNTFVKCHYLMIDYMAFSCIACTFWRLQSFWKWWKGLKEGMPFPGHRLKTHDLINGNLQMQYFFSLRTEIILNIHLPVEEEGCLVASLHIPVDCFYYARQCILWREQHHYAKSILFTDCFSRELPKGRYQTSYLNLHNGHAVIWFKKKLKIKIPMCINHVSHQNVNHLSSCGICKGFWFLILL